MSDDSSFHAGRGQHGAEVAHVLPCPEGSAVNVTVVEGDLLDQPVDVIVNAWNRNLIPWWLLLPQGVSGAIKRRGGTGPFRELRRHGAIPLGGAVLTSAGRLPFQAMVHVAGISLLWGPPSGRSATRCGMRSAWPRTPGFAPSPSP